MYKHNVQMTSNCIGQRLAQELATREHLRESTSWLEQRPSIVWSRCRRGVKDKKVLEGASQESCWPELKPVQTLCQ